MYTLVDYELHCYTSLCASSMPALIMVCRCHKTDLYAKPKICQSKYLLQPPVITVCTCAICRDDGSSEPCTDESDAVDQHIKAKMHTKRARQVRPLSWVMSRLFELKLLGEFFQLYNIGMFTYNILCICDGPILFPSSLYKFPIRTLSSVC